MSEGIPFCGYGLLGIGAQVAGVFHNRSVARSRQSLEAEVEPDGAIIGRRALNLYVKCMDEDSWPAAPLKPRDMILNENL